MTYNPCGTTGKQCSVLGFGGIRFKNIDQQDACVEMIGTVIPDAEWGKRSESVVSRGDRGY